MGVRKAITNSPESFHEFIDTLLGEDPPINLILVHGRLQRCVYDGWSG
jgi:hypothetical protein